MNDVKEICELTLDVPAPPLPGAAEAIGVARRAAHRRTHAMVGTYGLALTVAAGAVAGVALTRPARPDTTMAVATPAAATTSAPPLPVLSTTPPTDAQRKAQGRTVAGILIAATPAGYVARAADNSPGAEVWMVVRPGKPGYAGLVSVLISAGRGQGDLQSFTFANGRPAPTGPVCSAETTAYLVATVNDPAGLPCEAITIGGVPIRVDTQQDPELGEVKTATRFLNGGILQVIVEQGTPRYDNDSPLPPDVAHHTQRPPAPHKPRLASQPFTSAQLAALAANPNLLP